MFRPCNVVGLATINYLVRHREEFAMFIEQNGRRPLLQIGSILFNIFLLFPLATTEHIMHPSKIFLEIKILFS